MLTGNLKRTEVELFKCFNLIRIQYKAGVFYVNKAQMNCDLINYMLKILF